jgi:hypothetical protein
MSLRWTGIIAVGFGLAWIFFAACDEGSDVRTLDISVGDAGCTPAEFTVLPAQQVRLLIENDDDVPATISSEDLDLEPVHIEGEDNAEAFVTLPQQSGEYSLACEREGANVSEILLLAQTSSDLTPVVNPTSEPDMPETLSVSLVEYSVSPSTTNLTNGAYNIIATNVSSNESHELNVLQLQADGSYSPMAGMPPIAPQQGGALLVNFTPGTYRLACQIQIGEAGSEVDHYLQGMYVDVQVRERS